ncbi:MAG: zf-HC2 domain-containing protein [Thermoanaerobaculia bacterium]
MSGCRELEKLVAGGREAEFAAHRAFCPSCGEIGAEMERFAEAVAGLRAPSPGRALLESLYAIPRQTVSCEAAAELLAQGADGEVPPADAARLQNHLSRCGGCRESAAVLGVARELERPEPAPWLATRLHASRPKKAARRSARSWLFGPKGAIALAYAAAFAVMVLGLNPADLARSTGTARLEQTARTGVEAARSTFLDRFGALQERAFRTFQVVKGRASGYGRAALSNAIALVMRSESPRRPSRPRNEDGSGAWNRRQIEIWTWRADGSPGGEA